MESWVVFSALVFAVGVIGVLFWLAFKEIVEILLDRIDELKEENATLREENKVFGVLENVEEKSDCGDCGGDPKECKPEFCPKTWHWTSKRDPEDVVSNLFPSPEPVTEKYEAKSIFTEPLTTTTHTFKPVHNPDGEHVADQLTTTSVTLTPAEPETAVTTPRLYVEPKE